MTTAAIEFPTRYTPRIPLLPGTRLGPYEILSTLGAGGMGEVYRARDAKLNRDVAIKVLLPAVADDPDRLARFSREAQVLASLNHSNIAHIHGIEESNGITALVMELVEGEDLSQRIARGPMPIDEALPIARQIAEALEAAHEQGIIHRDLKPGNIKVRGDGTVKVLDFGLAKAMDSTGTSSANAMNSPTLSLHATQAGIILGTAAYMSPEQARGSPVDRRADLWAFGVVLYEMLAGTRPFEGSTISDTLAAVLRAEPDWTKLPADTPAAIRRLLRRCLEKDRKRRLPDAADMRLEIDDARTSPAEGTTPIATSQGTGRRALAISVAITAVVVAGVTAAVLWNVRPASVKPIVRFQMVLPEHQEFAQRSHVLAVSPDGERVVYVGGEGQLYLRAMADMDAHPIAGTGLNVMSPFFSPDGQWIGFYSFQDSTLKKIAVTGGAALTICKSDPPYGVVWEGDWIVFADQGTKGLLRVSPNGGEPEVLAAVGPGEVFAAPQMLDNGRSVLFTVASAEGADRWDSAQIVVQRIGSPERTVILRGGSEGHYVPTGHLVYMQGGTLLGVPFDSRTLQVRGGPVPIIEGVRRFTANVGSPAASVVFSPTGSLVYISGVTAGSLQGTIALATPDGTLQRLNLPPHLYLNPRISPDGSQLAVQTEQGNEAIIYIHDLKRGGPPRRLTFEGRNRYPVWTPDGRHVTFQSDRDGDRAIFWQLADGTRPAERLSKPDSLVEHQPEAWSPDGKALALALALAVTPPVGSRIFTLSLDGLRLTPFAANLPARHAAFAPDGKWLAYTSTEVGNREEIFVQPFPPTSAKYQISTEGGRAPLWSPDGTHLYYWAQLSQHIVAVDVQTQPTFNTGNVVVLKIVARFNTTGRGRNYDVTPDGKRFVVATSADGASPDATRPSTHQINAVLNWFEELKAHVPSR
ncbi:MAG TPA: protein kinase [Vicinamibacterales bacterium]|nr:protein kinase [Vicinamibacterales bacterium]